MVFISVSMAAFFASCIVTPVPTTQRLNALAVRLWLVSRSITTE